jgi:hypothetical protein
MSSPPVNVSGDVQNKSQCMKRIESEENKYLYDNLELPPVTHSCMSSVSVLVERRLKNGKRRWPFSKNGNI